MTHKWQNGTRAKRSTFNPNIKSFNAMNAIARARLLADSLLCLIRQQGKSDVLLSLLLLGIYVCAKYQNDFEQMVRIL